MARGKKTEAGITAILQMIEVGTPVKFAVVAGGICRETWHKWVRKDPKLKARVEVAMCKAVAHAVAQVRAAAKDSWQAAAWYLERTQPEFFALHTTQDIRTFVEEGEDMEFKVLFDDGAAVPVATDTAEDEEEAA